MLWLMLVACDGGTDAKSTNDSGGGPSGDDTASSSSSEDCNESWDSSAPSGASCTSGELQCGDVVEASTAGGGSDGDTTLYESAYCFVPDHDHDGPDRFYVFDAAEDSTFQVTLERPCEPLSLAVMRWDDAECPVGNAHNIGVCDGSEATTGSETLDMYTVNAARYYVAIDGQGGVESNFRLSITCD